MARARAAARPAPCTAAASAICAADGEDRVQRRHRLLEHHADGAAADGAHRALVEREEIAPVEADATGADVPGRRHEAHHRQRRQRLPAARLADEAQRPSGIERQADAVHRRRRAELDAQILDLQQRHAGSLADRRAWVEAANHGLHG